MMLIDSHAHIYAEEFKNDRPAAIRRAADSGVDLILMPAIDSSTHEAMLAVEAAYPACRAMMGLHPCYVTEAYEEELKLAATYLTKRAFIAIGEIGLDFYWDTSFARHQYDAFHRQIGWALQYDLPVVIHSRNATDECMEIVRQYPGLRGVFHCFSGNYDQAVRLVEIGFLLGIGGVLTFKKSGLEAVVQQIGITNIIIETDAPYLAPVPYRGKRNEPAYTAMVVEKLAAVIARPVEEVAKVVTENTKKLFRL